MHHYMNTDDVMNGDIADLLYQSIVSALGKARVDDIDEASARLLAIDGDRERAQITRGIVLVRLGRFHEAVTILESCVHEHGESGAALSNLAKAYEGSGDKDLAIDTLRRSLHLDPNQHAGLIWYAKLCHERDGVAGLVRVLEEVASHPGSWRPLLWLARMYLDGGNQRAAIQMYRKAMAMGYDSDSLLMIVGDLGNHGLASEALLLVADRYNPNLHDSRVGLNLLHCLLGSCS